MGWQEKAKGVMRSAVSCFGETAIYKPTGFTPVTVRLIFNQIYQEIDANQGLTLMSSKPNIGVKLEDFASTRKPNKGDIFTIREQDYLTDEVQDDGEAGVLILLNKKVN